MLPRSDLLGIRAEQDYANKKCFVVQKITEKAKQADVIRERD